jgi:MoaA/NifB/PqqE/SkfB family radical SAM enzyme
MLNNLTIITTMRCNLKCAHCLRGFPKERPDFPIDLLDKLLVEALPFGAKHIALTGGEPYLHPEFEKMVDKIVAYGYSWHFVSHGQRTEPYLPIMEKYKDKVSHVTLSIDGATPETHDEIRKHKGAFEKVIASAKKYAELGYKVRISTSLNQKNKTEVEALINLAQDINAICINVAGTIPTAWNKELVLNDDESLKLYQQISAVREKTKFDVRTLSSLHTRGGVNFCGNLNMHELTFNSRGELIFCCDTTENGAVTGSLREHSFSALIKQWLEQSNALQVQRAEDIATGNMGEKFDTCTFCNAYFNKQY